MKKLWVTLLLGLGSGSLQAQSDEIQQLLLNVEKLAQLKEILSDLERGYTLLESGYTTIKNLAQGNFKLHEAFLNQLLEVSPAVQNYARVAQLLSQQRQLLSEMQTARAQLGPGITASERAYVGRVYTRLYEESFKNLESLTLVLTAQQLRMSDQERLAAIDRLFERGQAQLVFLRQFKGQVAVLALSRRRETQQIQRLFQWYHP
ncbi:hypothetical protein [Siphonobacter curvatus]|uniref:TerB family tellurite resistance protein n=1 Tax=Siphonobacter curvatus TaxID=2094562 RepID=A0A2S7IEK5_9BACT|nr:hypothetical protein [Siphonobacter curvatus]PQA53194.1 hypothetical protein C5O19_25020 [Siphonobacter curvatus]